MKMLADKAKAIEQPATYEELSDLIDSSDEWAAGALMELFQFQTVDEQSINGTVHDNGVGFNGFDAPILTDMSKFYLERRYLTPKQLIFIRRTVKKYINQLLDHGVTPIGVKPYEPKEKPKASMTASILRNKETNKLIGIQVKFSFPKGDNRFRETLDKVKSLPNRRWIADKKYWKAGLSLEAGDKLKEWGFEFSEGLQKWYNDLKGVVASDIKEIEIPGLKGDPYPFQLQGISFIESRNGRALVADEMGLGKSLQALGYLQLHPEKRPAVIVCPASLKINWKIECKKWMSNPGDIQIISGKKNGCDLVGDIIIINYDILDAWAEKIIEYIGQKNSVLIGDEIHYTKNSQTIRTKAMKKLSKAFKHTIFLSGTPIVNKPGEFFNSINMIRSDLFPSYWRFMEKFTNKIRSPWTRSGWTFEGARNMDKLHNTLIETIMVRRKKEEVLTELPSKIKSVIPFEISNQKEYNQAQEDIVQWILENEGYERAKKANKAKVLAEFEKLKQLAVIGKLDSAVEWISDFLESGEKLVVFATHILTLDILQEKFGDISVRLDGSTSQANRQKAVDEFQNNDSVKLFLGNIKAAGVGITLTAASNVAFLELPWTPGDYEQASDRCHRIGQDDTVNIWVLIAVDTIEEDIANILSSKRKILDKVLDGENSDKETLLTELIKKIKGE